MLLLGKEIKGLKYNHWLSKLLPPMVEEEEKLILLPQVYKRDKNAITRMIEGHMGMTGQIAGLYARQQPNKVDDLLSVGFLACCEAVNNFITVHTDDNITAYIKVYIHGQIHNYMIEDQTIKPSRRIEGTQVYCAELNDARHTGIVHHFDTPNDLIEEMEMQDLEKLIAVMALEGYTDREIATIAKKSPARIGQVRKIVGQKILEALS